MILFFVFPDLQSVRDFVAHVGFRPEQGWNFDITTREIGDPVAMVAASPLVFGFPSDLGEAAQEKGGMFTGWRYVQSMN